MRSPCCSIDTEPSGAVGASDLEKTMTNTPITAGNTIGEWLEHASITFLLSDDSTNINGAVLTSDGGWSAA